MAELAADLCNAESRHGNHDHAAERWYWARCEVAEEHGETVLAGLEPIVADAAIEIEKWKIEDIDVDSVIAGLRKTLGRAHDCYRNVGHGAPARAFHEWRKHTKYHCLHARLLENVLPNDEDDRSRRFNELEGMVGDEHDCSMLIEGLLAEPLLQSDRADVRDLIAMAMQRRHELRQRSLKAAHGLFDESVKGYCKRVKASWQASRRAACDGVIDKTVPDA